MTEALQEVLITRIFDAPREAVFRAWTEPDEVATWYGPEHFHVPRERIHIAICASAGATSSRWSQRDGGAECAVGYEIIEPTGACTLARVPAARSSRRRYGHGCNSRPTSWAARCDRRSSIRRHTSVAIQ